MSDSNLGGQVTDHILILLKLYECLTQFKSLKLGFIEEMTANNLLAMPLLRQLQQLLYIYL